MREDELVAGTRHRDVEQAAFLADRCFRGGWIAAAEPGWERERISSSVPREASGDETRQEDDRELEALRLVDGQNSDRVRVRIQLGRRWVVARLDQCREVRRDEHGPVVTEKCRLRTDDLEEPRHV